MPKLSLDSNNTTVTQTSNPIAGAYMPQGQQTQGAFNGMSLQDIIQQLTQQNQSNSPTKAVETPPVLPTTVTSPIVMPTPGTATLPEFKPTTTIPDTTQPIPEPTAQPAPQPSTQGIKFLNSSGQQLNPSLASNSQYISGTYNPAYTVIKPTFETQGAYNPGFSTVLDTKYTQTQGYHSTSALGFGGVKGALDVATPIGTPIKAIKNGGVVYATNSVGGEMYIKYPDGTTQINVHLSQYAPVGTKVNAGDIIGKTGVSGFATGPHLHFEVIDGNGRSITSNYLPNSGATGTSLQSIPSMTGLQSTPFMSGLQSIPSMTGLQSTPFMSGLQSIPSMTGLQSTPFMSGLQSIPQLSGLQSIISGSGLQSIPPSAEAQRITMGPGLQSIPPLTEAQRITMGSGLQSIPPKSQMSIAPYLPPTTDLPTPTTTITPTTDYNSILTNAINSNNPVAFNPSSYNAEIEQILQSLNPKALEQTDLGKNANFSYEDKFILANYGDQANRLSASDLVQARQAARKRRESQDLTDKLVRDRIASQQALSGAFRRANPLRQNPYTAGTQQAQAYDNQIILAQQNAINNILSDFATRDQAIIDESANIISQVAANPEKRVQEFNNLVTSAKLKRATIDQDTAREMSLLPAKGAYELALAKLRSEVEVVNQNNSLPGNINALTGINSLLDLYRSRLNPTMDEATVIGKVDAGIPLTGLETNIYKNYQTRATNELAGYNSIRSEVQPLLTRLQDNIAVLNKNQ